MILTYPIITGSEHDILRFLYNYPRNVQSIADFLNVERTGAYTYLHRMTKKGLVARNQGCYVLTEKGRKFGDQIRDEWNDKGGNSGKEQQSSSK